MAYLLQVVHVLRDADQTEHLGAVFLQGLRLFALRSGVADKVVFIVVLVFIAKIRQQGSGQLCLLFLYLSLNLSQGFQHGRLLAHQRFHRLVRFQLYRRADLILVDAVIQVAEQHQTPGVKGGVLTVGHVGVRVVGMDKGVVIDSD